jgi:hypothetical protein
MARRNEVDEFEEYSDEDRDALHILPLSIVPLDTTALRRARMIKNAQLRGVVEFFHGRKTGSGQLEVGQLALEFGWKGGMRHADRSLLEKLAVLPSYDVYSLRILLRENGIPVNDSEALKLSEKKKLELTDYMKKFTRPLILQIYGEQDMTIRELDDIIRLFRDPDIPKAREKLKIMAERLEIQLEEVPKFLEDYGDIFLSLSYYRECLDLIAPVLRDFLASLGDIRTAWQLRHDRNLINTCNVVEANINQLRTDVVNRFESFDRSTKDMWNKISAERFHMVEQLIQSYHTTIGGILCTLTVKLNAWSELFPSRHAGGPMRRAEFLMGEMKQGIENIWEFQETLKAASRRA